METVTYIALSIFGCRLTRTIYFFKQKTQNTKRKTKDTSIFSVRNINRIRIAIVYKNKKEESNVLGDKERKTGILKLERQ